ncbi:MAG: acetyl-CoA carboxylase biotin carboxyl carrier protein subunit [bacterium]
MKLKYENNTFDVDVNNTGGQISAKINGKNSLFKIGASLPNMFSIAIPNSEGEEQLFKFYTAEDDNHIFVNCDGDCIVFDKVKEEEKSFDDNGIDSGNKQTVLPPMPGTIVKVLVENGQTVSEGDALIIVEAMKMETTLYAAIDGKVTEVNAQAGEQVDADKVLIVVEKDE